MSPSAPVPAPDPSDLHRSLVIPPEFARLRELRDFTRGIAREVGFDEDRTHDIALAASEAAANAIEHGPEGSAGVRLLCSGTGSVLEVSIESAGPFTVRHGEPPTGYARGLGLPLMLSLADEVAFGNADGVVVVILRFLRAE